MRLAPRAATVATSRAGKPGWLAGGVSYDTAAALRQCRPGRDPGAQCREDGGKAASKAGLSLRRHYPRSKRIAGTFGSSAQTRQGRNPPGPAPFKQWIPKASLWRSLRQSLNLACCALLVLRPGQRPRRALAFAWQACFLPPARLRHRHRCVAWGANRPGCGHRGATTGLAVAYRHQGASGVGRSRDLPIEQGRAWCVPWVRRRVARHLCGLHCTATCHRPAPGTFRERRVVSYRAPRAWAWVWWGCVYWIGSGHDACSGSCSCPV